MTAADEKLILIASSPFFQNILRKNKHPHPLIYMRGVRSVNISAMMDFLYFGEANVHPENLDIFLQLAEELQLKGLRGNWAEKEGNVCQEPPIQSPQPKLHKLGPTSKNNNFKKNVSLQNGQNQTVNEKSLALVNDTTNNTDLESLDKQVKSMMRLSDNTDPRNKKYGKARFCNVCGKEGSMADIMNHIEGNHISGISIPCDLCEKLCKSRNALRSHKSKKHGKIEIN